MAAPAAEPGWAQSTDPSLSGARLLTAINDVEEGMEGRNIGLDVHRDFCEVACCQAGKVTHWPRVSARPGPLQEFAEQSRSDDRVALEATSNALAIAPPQRCGRGRAGRGRFGIMRRRDVRRSFDRRFVAAGAIDST